MYLNTATEHLLMAALKNVDFRKGILGVTMLVAENKTKLQN